MFINWKMILTVMIVLAVLFSFLGMNPVVTGFFSSIFGKLGVSLHDVARIDTPLSSKPVNFSVVLEDFDEISFNGRSLDISIEGETSAVLSSGKVDVNKTVRILGYGGSGSVGQRLVLDGTFKSLDWPEIKISVNGPIKLNSSYSLVSIDGMWLSSYDAVTKGTLNVKGTETSFSGHITIEEPSGRFMFEQTNTSRLYIVGTAKRISIPGLIIK